MANTLGLTKIAEKGINKLKQKVTEQKHTVAEKVNPYSSTNKTNRQERKNEKAELKRVEIQALREERVKQAKERAERRAKQEFGTGKEQHRSSRSAPRRVSSGGRRSGGGSFYNSRNTPEYREQATFVPPQSGFNAPDAWGNFSQKKAKTAPTPTETTVVKQGNQTITIKKKLDPNAQNQQAKQSSGGYEFPDILGMANPSPTPSKGFGKRKQSEASYPDVLGLNTLNKKKTKEFSDPFADFLP